MKLNFKTVTTLLLILLIGILIIVFIRYYNTPIRVVTVSTDNTSSGSQTKTNQNPPVLISKEDSGDLSKTNESLTDKTPTGTIISSGENEANIDSGELLTSPEKKSEDSSALPEKKPGETPTNQENPPKESEKGSKVIITSEDTMTNKEKRDILTELDNTLMELLDVVDKVQTIDETRLITDESEVQN